MYHITLICIGNLKEPYLRDGCLEYIKRLRLYCKLNIIEIPESKLPSQPSGAQVQHALQEEASAILNKIPKDSAVYAMCIEGTSLNSEGFAESIHKTGTNGVNHLCFIIGSSFGLSGLVKAKAFTRLSLSRMTFPHQLSRLILLEQIYRAFQILTDGKYHK